MPPWINFNWYWFAELFPKLHSFAVRPLWVIIIAGISFVLGLIIMDVTVNAVNAFDNRPNYYDKARLYIGWALQLYAIVTLVIGNYLLAIIPLIATVLVLVGLVITGLYAAFGILKEIFLYYKKAFKLTVKK